MNKNFGIASLKAPSLATAWESGVRMLVDDIGWLDRPESARKNANKCCHS